MYVPLFVFFPGIAVARALRTFSPLSNLVRAANLTSNFRFLSSVLQLKDIQIHLARQFPVKVGKTVHSNVTVQPSTLAVSRNTLRNIPKAPFQSLGIE
jgi:hypothetical protein